MTVVDTQAVIWATREPERLSRAAAEALSKAKVKGELTIADITLSEIAMLIARGRVKLGQPGDVYLRFVEQHFHVVPINSRIAIQAQRFGLAYPGDPADRLIGATAVVHGVSLVTADREIRASGEVVCIW